MFENDGWDCDEIRDSGLMDTLRRLSDVEYNLRNCNRGAARWGDTLRDLAEYIDELADELRNAISEFREVKE